MKTPICQDRHGRKKVAIGGGGFSPFPDVKPSQSILLHLLLHFSFPFSFSFSSSSLRRFNGLFAPPLVSSRIHWASPDPNIIARSQLTVAAAPERNAG